MINLTRAGGETVDAPVSGAGAVKCMWVQIPSCLNFFPSMPKLFNFPLNNLNPHVWGMCPFGHLHSLWNAKSHLCLNFFPSMPKLFNFPLNNLNPHVWGMCPFGHLHSLWNAKSHLCLNFLVFKI